MFIELTHNGSNVKFLVAVAHIGMIGPASIEATAGAGEIRMADGKCVTVNESYADLKRLLEYVASCQSYS